MIAVRTDLCVLCASVFPSRARTRASITFVAASCLRDAGDQFGLRTRYRNPRQAHPTEGLSQVGPRNRPIESPTAHPSAAQISC